jgi:hypothetical protein
VANAAARRARAVAFLQRQKSLHILGAGVVALK